jgi:feruloyl esterase
VTGIARPTTDSDIRFEVAIPQGGAWNGRYVQVGNGGFAGSIYESGLLKALAMGYAAAGTDDGHQSRIGTDASWAMGHPQKVIDFGYRALKETTDAAKAIILAYQGRGPKFSYFQGCSDGGREALMEAQRFPADFDGIVAGDPANHWTHLQIEAAWNIQALTATAASYIPRAKLKALEAAVVRECGDADGVVEDPMACKFDPAVIRCAAADGPACLTDAQIAAARKIYGGARNPRTGAAILAGFSPGGENETQGWGPWLIGSPPSGADSLEYAFSSNFFRYVVFGDASYDIRRLNFDGDVAMTDARFGHIFNSYSPDLTAFRDRGGKLIQYHGWADPAIPPLDSVGYYRAVQAKMGDTRGFYRLFMAPGMFHCGGGPGPNVLATQGAIAAWVEEGKAPASLLATKYQSDNPALPPLRTRPLCPFPAKAQWDGKGDASRAESFRCAGPKPPKR